MERAQEHWSSDLLTLLPLWLWPLVSLLSIPRPFECYPNIRRGKHKHIADACVNMAYSGVRELAAAKSIPAGKL